MNIRGSKKDIVNICLGHEAEGYALGWLTYNKDREIPKDNLGAYEDGFERGIRFLANYLQEYGITIEINDDKVDTISKDVWYSGEIIDKTNPIDDGKLDELAKETWTNRMKLDSVNHVIVMWDNFIDGFKSGYRKAMEE